jgi:hypothetical protein
VRPKDKEDIYNWRGKEAGLQLKVFRRDNIPMPTLDRFRKKEE